MKALFLLVYLAVLSVFDWREKKIPVVFLWIGALSALGVSVYEGIRTPEDCGWIILSMCLGVLPGAFLTMIAYLTKKAGYGDGLVLINIGLLLGYRESFLLLCFSMLAMAVFAIGMLVAKKVNRHSTLPYLPFLTAVYLAGMFIGGSGKI